MLGLAFVAWPGCAWAQDDLALARTDLFARDRNIAVAERAHPEYAAAPIALGAFQITPSIESQLGFTDNLYATRTNLVADGFIRLAPGIQAQTNWSRHFIAVYASAVSTRYVVHQGENTVDWNVGTLGRYDIASDWGAAAGVNAERQTEQAGSEDTPQGLLRPVQYRHLDGFVESTKTINRLRLTLRGDAEDFTFDPGVDFRGEPVFQADRDRHVATVSVRSEYAISPAASVFVTSNGNWRFFAHNLPGEPLRDSQGYSIDAGLNFDVTKLIRGEFFAGYLAQQYHHRVYGSIDGPSFGAKINYFMTPLITVTATAARTIQDAVLAGVGGYVANDVSLQLDHELLRNLVLALNVTSEVDSFHGVDRTDNRMIETFTATYKMQRHIALKLALTHADETSGGDAGIAGFAVNRVLASFVYQL